MPNWNVWWLCKGPLEGQFFHSIHVWWLSDGPLEGQFFQPKKLFLPDSPKPLAKEMLRSRLRPTTLSRMHWDHCCGSGRFGSSLPRLMKHPHLNTRVSFSNEVSTEWQIEKQGCESWKDATNTNKPSKKGMHCYSSYSYYWRKSTSFTFCWNNSYNRDMQRAMETKFHRSTFLQAVLLAANARWTKVIRISHLASTVSNIAWCIGEVDSPLWLLWVIIN